MHLSFDIVDMHFHNSPVAVVKFERLPENHTGRNSTSMENLLSLHCHRLPSIFNISIFENHPATGYCLFHFPEF